MVKLLCWRLNDLIQTCFLSRVVFLKKYRTNGSNTPQCDRDHSDPHKYGSKVISDKFHKATEREVTNAAGNERNRPGKSELGISVLHRKDIFELKELFFDKVKESANVKRKTSNW